MESMGIGELARRAGVKPSALRYYEGIGLLPLPERTNGQRRYDGEALREVLERLAVVRVAQQTGFTITEIGVLLDGLQLGMFVQVHRGSREADLRGRIGIVRQRFGKHSYSPFEVQFGNKQLDLELLWAGEFEEW